MRFLLNVIRFSFVAVGIACCMAGMAQIDSAQPDFYISRNIAELQSDTVKVLKGIALILLGIAQHIFMYLNAYVIHCYMLLLYFRQQVADRGRRHRRQPVNDPSGKHQIADFLHTDTRR